MDITIFIELLIIIAMFFAYKYLRPMLQDATFKKFAQIAVMAANELYIVGELNGSNKWEYAWDMMVKKLEKYNIKFDEQEIRGYLKAAVTALRVEISNTDA